MAKIDDAVTVFLIACNEAGFTPGVKGAGIVYVTKAFAAGDKQAFCACDSDGPSLLALVPLKGGSVWGTDGGSIGGMSALTHGRYTLNKSGSSGARFVKALVKAGVVVQS